MIGWSAFFLALSIIGLTIPPHGGWYRVADLFCLVGAILNGVNLFVAVHRKIRAEGAP